MPRFTQVPRREAPRSGFRWGGTQPRGRPPRLGARLKDGGEIPNCPYLHVRNTCAAGVSCTSGASPVTCLCQSLVPLVTGRPERLSGSGLCMVVANTSSTRSSCSSDRRRRHHCVTMNTNELHPPSERQRLAGPGDTHTRIDDARDAHGRLMAAAATGKAVSPAVPRSLRGTRPLPGPDAALRTAG